jgi:hypothetical protein
MSFDELSLWSPWLLAAAVWALALRISLRHFWTASGVSGFDAGSWGGPEDLAPPGKGELYAKLYQQLVDLGFQPVGVTWEKLLGKRKIESFAFLHPSESWRASVWPALGGDFRVYFVTQFTDGASVLTGNYPRRPTEGPNHLARGVPTMNLELLLDEHRSDVGQFMAAGHVTERCASLADIVEAKRVYMLNTTVQSRFRATEWYNFLTRVSILGVLPSVIALAAISGGWVTSPLYGWLLALCVSIILALRLKTAKQEVLKEMTAQQHAADEERSATRRSG